MADSVGQKGHTGPNNRRMSHSPTASSHSAEGYSIISATCTDMHTGGEPLRIVESVKPTLQLDGAVDLLAKRRLLRSRFDSLRRFVVEEPRGHADMYACLLMLPECEEAKADASVLFMHNEGYSTMCGHAVIALAKYAVAKGLVEPTPPVTKVNIECPCGLVAAEYHHGDGSSSFTSVPAFLHSSHSGLRCGDRLLPDFDVAYGGAFYIVVNAESLGLSLRSDPIGRLVEACRRLQADAAAAGVSASHPVSSDLAFVYGVVLTDGEEGDADSANLCVFADGQVDRSPTGSGVTARMAARFAKGLVKFGEVRRFMNSKTGSSMLAEVVESLGDDFPSPAAVRVRVSGSASFTGSATFTAEAGDPLLPGFRIA